METHITGFTLFSSFMGQGRNKTIQKTNCQLISSDPFVMFPIKSKLDRIFEPLAEKGFWSKLGFSQMCVIKI